MMNILRNFILPQKKKQAKHRLLNACFAFSIFLLPAYFLFFEAGLAVTRSIWQEVPFIILWITATTLTILIFLIFRNLYSALMFVPLCIAYVLHAVQQTLNGSELTVFIFPIIYAWSTFLAISSTYMLRKWKREPNSE